MSSSLNPGKAVQAGRRGKRLNKKAAGVTDCRLVPLWSDLVYQPVQRFCVLLVRLLCSRINFFTGARTSEDSHADRPSTFRNAAVMHSRQDAVNLLLLVCRRCYDGMFQN